MTSATLTYTRDFQISLLIHLLYDPKFFKDVHERMHLTDFDLPACRLIFEITRAYYAKFKSMPSFNVLTLELIQATRPSSPYETTLQDGELESLAGVMDMLGRFSLTNLTTPYFREHLPLYLCELRTRQVRELALPTQQEIEKIVNIRQDMTRLTGNQIILINAMDKIEDEDPVQGLRLSTGIAKVDGLLGGGIKRQETAMIVACTGVGKTNAMLNFTVSNALRGIYSLFITMENVASMIIRRYQGMMTNVDANWLIEHSSRRPQDVAWRLNYANSPQFRFNSHVTIADLCTGKHGVTDIERAIIQWKEHMIERRGLSENVCCLVCVDWLERVDSAGISRITKHMNDARVLQIILEELGEMARRHNVGMWTATQGTRDAQGREFLDIKHTAHAIHIHDPLDLSIGLAPVQTGNSTGVDLGLSDDSNIVQPPCDRTLNISFMKARSGALTGRVRPLYQGPTLRFWNDKSTADKVNQYLSKCHSYDELERMYDLMLMKPGVK